MHMSVRAGHGRPLACTRGQGSNPSPAQPLLGQTQRAPRTCRVLCGGRKQSGCCHNNPARGRAPGPLACPAACSACFSVAQKGSGRARRAGEPSKMPGSRPPTWWRGGMGNIAGDARPSASGEIVKTAVSGAANYENKAGGGRRAARWPRRVSQMLRPRCTPLAAAIVSTDRMPLPSPAACMVQAGPAHAPVQGLRPAQSRPAQARCPARACRRPRRGPGRCCGRRSRFRSWDPRRRRRRTRTRAAAARPAPGGAPPARRTAGRTRILG